MVDPSSSSADREKAELYASLEMAVLRRMVREVEAEDCAPQVIAAAVSMLRAGGVQARGANAGAVGSDEKAVAEWLRGLPPDKALELARKASENRGGGRGLSERLRAARVKAESAPAA